MRNWLTPFFLVLALLMAILGFATVWTGAPETNTALHQARTVGDEPTESALEEDLQRRKTQHWVLVGTLFGGSVLLAVGAFVVMKPSH